VIWFTKEALTAGAVLRGLLAFALVLVVVFLVMGAFLVVAAAFFAGADLVVLLALVTFFSVVLAFSDFSVAAPGFLSLTGPDLPVKCQSCLVDHLLSRSEVNVVLDV
jgi:hypothetical protein